MTSKTKQFFEKKFSKHIESQVRHYQKLYKFDMPNNSTHNNEADAFKHTFMQAVLALYGTQNFAKFLGDMHERDGNILNSQPRGEEIMDQHNNAQGREIAKEIISQYSWIIKSPATMPFAYNLIAKNVYKRMQQGKIILDPSGRTKLKNHKENLDKHGNTTYEKNYLLSNPPQNNLGTVTEILQVLLLILQRMKDKKLLINTKIVNHLRVCLIMRFGTGM